MPVRLWWAPGFPSLERSVRRRFGESALFVDATGRPPSPSDLAGHDLDLVVAGPRSLPGSVEAWIADLRALADHPDVVLIHDREDPKFRAAMLRAGALAVLYGGLPENELVATLEVLVRRRSESSTLAVRAMSPLGRSSLEDFVSNSPKMREFLDLARRLVDADSSLLVLGETGTGKERLASAIHEEGPRSRGPFVAVNCGALTETLLESELFGHEKGAFTGAIRARKGYFEQADGGTIFLDEIAEVPLHVQVKLLRVLESRRIQRVGGERPFPVDVRVMAATNRDLDEEVRARRFRRDLYYRLAVVTLVLPPLRERREDVAALARSYLEHFRGALNKPVYGFEPDSMEVLVGYHWPGNVRELINVIERAVLLARGPAIRPADLPRSISIPGVAAVAGPVPAAPGEPDDLPVWLDQPIRLARREVVDSFERRYLAHALREANGRVGKAARRAGINERSLYDLMKRHGLRKEDYRGPG